MNENNNQIPESLAIVSAQQDIQKVISNYPNLSINVWYLLFSDVYSKISAEFNANFMAEREEYIKQQEMKSSAELVKESNEDIIEEV